VKAGRIAPGSIFLVENLDRLSREQTLDALGLFTDIIKAGIKIVTLTDGMEYTRETINANMMQLMMSLVILSRGHEESQRKSQLGKAAWVGKRAKLGERKLTAAAPAWLELSDDRKTFCAIPERAAIVRRIYEMNLQGIGKGSIVKLLNAENKWNRPNFKGKRGGNQPNGWQESYVYKILTSRAVIGEFQPQTKIKVGEHPDGRDKCEYQPAGALIPDYYPAVVEPGLFHLVQAKLAANQKKGGRNGRIANLFGHIARCGYCGGPMAYIDKGPLPKGGQFLVCDTARRGAGCGRHPIRYPDFEELILTYCRGLEVAELLPNAEAAQTATEAARERLAAIRAEYTAIQAKIVNVGDTIADTPDRRVRELLQASMTVFLNEAEALEKREQAARHELTQLSTASENTAAQLASLAELIQFMAQGGPEEVAAVRMRLRAKLRGLIEKIKVYPLGMKRAWMTKLLCCQPDMEHGEAVAARLASGGYDTGQQYIIRFASGVTRTLEPGKPAVLTAEYDPAEARRTITINKEGEVDISLDGEKEWETPSIRPQKNRRQA
jgi:DNA invertase Pin-like site-specific DNA recombinase